MAKSHASVNKSSPLKWKGLHNRVNPIMETFVNSVKSSYVPLGPTYGRDGFLQDEYNLILHRICKKFERPDDSQALIRKNNTVSDMFDYDNEWAIRWFQPARDKTIEGFERHQLYLIREKLREIVNSHYSFCVDNIGFPSGETVVTSKGDVSLYAKLRDREQLTCTEECFTRFAKLSYNHAGLKHAIKRHFRQLVDSSGLSMKTVNKYIYASVTKLHSKNVPFWAFVVKLRYVITIVDSARITTVPKENSKDRVIELDALCNMICQRTIANSIRKLIKKVFDIDLDESQVIHRLLINDLTNATIDLKNASNSVWFKVVEWFLSGTKLFSDLSETRCGTVRFNDTKHSLNMLAPMGNGFTFEIMTLILLTVCREYDSFAHVFGDDIIVDRDVASSVITMLNHLGFQINESKTFIDGSFRESCGGFTSNEKYITSFDFEWCEDEVDAVVVLNKLWVLMNTTQHNELKKQLRELHAELMTNVPPLLLRGRIPIINFAGNKLTAEKEHFLQLRRQNRRNVDGDLYSTNHVLIGGHTCVILHGGLDLTDSRYDLSAGVYCDLKTLQRLQRNDDRCKEHYKSRHFSRMRADLNWDHRLGDQRSSAHVTLILRKTNKQYTFKDSKGRKRPWKPVDNVSRLIAHYYLACGRVLTPTFKKTYVSTNLVQHCVL